MTTWRLLACALIAAAGTGAAHAQATATACDQIVQLMAKPQSQVKALQGDKVSEDKDAIAFKAKVSLPGFSSCSLESDNAVDKFSGYLQHHLSCDGEAADADAANTLVETLWACTRDIYSERHAGEAWIGGRYRIISFAGEAPTAGRAAGLVDFGATDYARISLEKAYDMSDEYHLHIYWLFK